MIDSNAAMNLAIADSLTSPGDVTFEILNNHESNTNIGNGGGSIGGRATIDFSANTLAGASLLALINNSGGSIVGGSNISLTIGGALSTTGDATLQIFNNDNGDGSGPGTIGSDATIEVTAANISTGGSLFADIFNYSGGNISGSANINSNLTGDLTTLNDATFSIDNSSGGTIGGDAIVNVTASGDINTQGNATFNIENFSSGSGGGTIVGDATINVSAASISTSGDLMTGINNIGGIIDGNATATWNVPGALTIQGVNGAVWFILNGASSDSAIHGNATLQLSAASLDAGSVGFVIANRNGGMIDLNATLGFNLSGDLTTTQAGAGFTIFNTDDGSGSATITGSAVINIDAGNITCAPDALDSNALVVQIKNTGGSIGSNATVNLAASGNVDAQGNAFLQVLNENDGVSGPGTINGDATLNVTSGASFSIAGLLYCAIDNSSAGSITGNANLSFSLSGDLTTQGDATFVIANGNLGTIGGGATMNVTAANITANALLAQIDNTGGSIGAGLRLGLRLT